MSYTRIYRYRNWTVSVPESLISQGDDGSYFLKVGGSKQGPFTTEEDMALWMVNNRSRTVNSGIMTECKTPEDYNAIVSESQEDIAKIMQAFVASGVAFQYVPPEIDKLFVYMVLIKRKDRKAAENAIALLYG